LSDPTQTIPMLRDAAAPLLSMRELENPLVLRRPVGSSRRAGEYSVVVGLDPTTSRHVEQGPRIKSGDDGMITERLAA